MDWLAFDDPIIACATGSLENTAISIIRITGFKKITELQGLFKKDLLKVIPRTASLVKIYFNNKPLDQVVLTYYPGPNSYNGENILELSAHGNPLNVRRIIEAFNSIGVRDAGPGEITYRALRNNKLTMTQVEGLDTLLNANSVDMISEGLSNLEGSLQKEYLKLKELYLNLKGSVEILIDFSEDVGEATSYENLSENFKKFQRFVSSLKNRIDTPSSHLLKPRVVLVGETNAGKSSLFNHLIDEKRSIVSNIEGTTRDYITENFYHRGVEFQIVDTAGLRESGDLIELEGMRLSKDLYNDAFFKILVINPLQNTSLNTSLIEPDAVILTHADSTEFTDKVCKISKIAEVRDVFWSGSIGAKNQSGPIEPLDRVGPIGPALEIGPIGPGLEIGPIGPEDLLKNLIYTKYKKLVDQKPILPTRQRAIISQIYDKVDSIAQVLSETEDIGIISSEINTLAQSVDSVLGITTPDDVLNNIFSNFCIGK